MMRTPSKVMMVSSSPGRAEKLPAPLLSRLLRGKGGSRSRGRSSSLSRSSPMFVARRRSASSVDIHDEKEPSSPKVTCIGQVRINKRKCSTSFSSSSSSRSKQQPQGCRCLQRGFFCNPFSRRLNVRFGRPPSSAPSPPPYRHHPPRPRGWRRWLLLPRPGCYWQRKAQRQQQHLWEEDGPRTPAGAPAAKPGSDDEGERSEQGDMEEDEEEETKVFVPTTPPKNALLLMRCRSAPHRPAPAQEAVKARAMRVLKQRRMYEGQRDMIYNQTFNLDQVAFAAEGLKDAQQTMSALKSANKELKGMMKTVKISEIDSMQDEMMDLMDVSSEIQESLGRSYNVPDDIDEDELLGELDALEADMGAETEADSMPSYLQPDKESDLEAELNLPAAPTGHSAAPAGRQNVQAEDELGLPAVPRASIRG